MAPAAARDVDPVPSGLQAASSGPAGNVTKQVGYLWLIYGYHLAIYGEYMVNDG